MAHWQPQQQGLNDLLILLRDAIQPESRDQALVQQVTRCIRMEEEETD